MVDETASKQSEDQQFEVEYISAHINPNDGIELNEQFKDIFDKFEVQNETKLGKKELIEENKTNEEKVTEKEEKEEKEKEE